MFFLASHAEAGAHCAAFHPAALANANTAQCRVGKTPFISRELKMRLRSEGVVVGAKTQILVDAIGIHYLPRIHLPIRIPDRLELAKRPHKFVAEHLRQ